MTNPFKGRTGLDRVVRAIGYSIAGLKTAYNGESAFRQEAWAALVLIPAAFWLGRSWVENGVVRHGAFLPTLLLRCNN